MQVEAFAFKIQIECTEHECKFRVRLGVKNEAHSFLTYPINQLSHHAVPHLDFGVFGAIFAIRHKLQLVLVAHVLGDLCGQLHDVAFVLVIPHQLLVVFLQHHVWRLLPERGQAQG